MIQDIVFFRRLEKILFYFTVMFLAMNKSKLNINFVTFSFDI